MISSHDKIDGLAQDCSISSVLAVELPQSCANTSKLSDVHYLDVNQMVVVLTLRLSITL